MKEREESVSRLQILRGAQDDREKGFPLKFKQVLKEYEQITCPQNEEEPKNFLGRWGLIF